MTQNLSHSPKSIPASYDRLRGDSCEEMLEGKPSLSHPSWCYSFHSVCVPVVTPMFLQAVSVAAVALVPTKVGCVLGDIYRYHA